MTQQGFVQFAELIIKQDKPDSSGGLSRQRNTLNREAFI
jgi:hypothetical protein